MFSQASVSHSVHMGWGGYPWFHVLSRGLGLVCPGGGYGQGVGPSAPDTDTEW